MAGVHIPSVALGRLAHIFLFEKNNNNYHKTI